MSSQINDYDLRPYRDEEVVPILAKLKMAPGLMGLISKAFPQLDLDLLKEIIAQIKTVEDFQSRIMAAGIDYLIQHTSDGLTASGLEHLNRDESYTFISNHRDISLDSALLARETYRHLGRTMEMAIGDNLVTSDWLHHLFKLNKTVIVHRGLSPRALLAASKRLSQYVFDLVGNGVDNFWIAQAEGRAKDGVDHTQSGVVKMLALAAKGEPLDLVRTLKPVPVSISYEYDPNDLAKARERLAKKRTGQYNKASDEDLRSIMHGLRGYKGRIHLTISPLIKEDQIRSGNTRNERTGLLVEALDEAIISGYKLWPTNYLAEDLLVGKAQPGKNYSEAELGKFQQRMDQLLKDESDREDLRTLILEMYANPLRQQRKRQ